MVGGRRGGEIAGGAFCGAAMVSPGASGRLPRQQDGRQELQDVAIASASTLRNLQLVLRACTLERRAQGLCRVLVHVAVGSRGHGRAGRGTDEPGESRGWGWTAPAAARVLCRSCPISTGGPASGYRPQCSIPRSTADRPVLPTAEPSLDTAGHAREPECGPWWRRCCVRLACNAPLRCAAALATPSCGRRAAAAAGRPRALGPSCASALMAPFASCS